MAAPAGNQNGKKGKEWFDAIRKECVQRDALGKIAKVLVDKAIEGEQWAVAEIGNRFDGKPAQSVDLQGNMTAEIKWPLRKPEIDP
jgi:hypothetical protein